MLNKDIISHLNIFSSIATGEQALQMSSESLDDGTAIGEDVSPPPQGRRNRREACTCPFCKDGEGRYVTQPAVRLYCAYSVGDFSTAS